MCCEYAVLRSAGLNTILQTGKSGMITIVTGLTGTVHPVLDTTTVRDKFEVASVSEDTFHFQISPYNRHTAA